MGLRKRHWDRMIARRDAAILSAAIELAKQQRGVSRLKRADVAQAAQVAVGGVNNAYGTMDALRDEVMRQAVTLRIPEILAGGLAERHPVALDAPPDLRAEAAQLLALS